MKRFFHIMSDIHLESRKKDFKVILENSINKNNILKISQSFPQLNINFDPNEKNNVNLILAGDIGYPSMQNYRDFLLKSTELYDNIYMIAGNHEFYYGKQTVEQILSDIKLICSEINEFNKSNINNGHLYFLDNDMVSNNDIRILGSTLWTNVTSIDRVNSKYINDYNLITDFDVDKSNELYNQNYKWLKESLGEIIMEKNTNPNIKTIIITHHLPSFKLINPKYKSYSNINCFFASNSDELISNPVNYWIYGHTHTKTTHNINGVNIMCNPIGYVGEEKTYDPYNIFEL